MKEMLYKTIHHYFPGYHKWLNGVKDHRNENMIVYEPSTLIWVGILLFLSKIGSRRQINYEFGSDEMRRNIQTLARQEIERIPHDTTLEYFLMGLAPGELSEIRRRMIYSLIRRRCLEKFRFSGYYLIAGDGSGYLRFNTRHCEHCLTQEKEGEVLYYYHPVVEAKLVLRNGMALSIGTEFIENPNEEARVQDSESKAFRRLAERLKKEFPQLRICFLLDGLYANKPVIDFLSENSWKYIVTFKEGSMPAVYEEYQSLKKVNPDNRGTHDGEGVERKYRWASDVMYYKDTPGINVLECVETKGGTEKKFVWLTNFEIDKNNFNKLGETGRLRWKIENEGFNVQKNGGYELEHPYSEDIVALKNFYLLLQIAHIINQLMEKGSLLSGEVKKVFGSIRNLARRLLESLRTTVYDPVDIKLIESTKFQIRLESP